MQVIVYITCAAVFVAGWLAAVVVSGYMSVVGVLAGTGGLHSLRCMSELPFLSHFFSLVQPRFNLPKLSTKVTRRTCSDAHVHRLRLDEFCHCLVAMTTRVYCPTPISHNPLLAFSG